MKSPLTMGNISPRGIQATNMVFSSWALVFLAIGIIMGEWVELTLETKKNTVSHSPWICCTTLWPEGQNCAMERDGWRGRVHLSLTSIYLTGLLIIILWGNFCWLHCTQLRNQESRLTLKSRHFEYFGEKFRSSQTSLLDI